MKGACQAYLSGRRAHCARPGRAPKRYARTTITFMGQLTMLIIKTPTIIAASLSLSFAARLFVLSSSSSSSSFARASTYPPTDFSFSLAVSSQLSVFSSTSREQRACVCMCVRSSMELATLARQRFVGCVKHGPSKIPDE